MLPWNVLRHDYPYFVQRTNDGRYMLANRNYSPVGDPQLDWVDYETHPNRVWIRSLTEEIAKELSVDGKGTLDSFYLYESAVEPWDSEEKFAAYKERYNRLMRLIEKEKGQSVTYL